MTKVFVIRQGTYVAPCLLRSIGYRPVVRQLGIDERRTEDWTRKEMGSNREHIIRHKTRTDLGGKPAADNSKT